ncbi:MAG: enoyl-CoA hydratase [Acidimicrobiales bacterium]
MAEENLVFEVSGRVATLTLNRPAARNALSGELLGALFGAMEQCASRDDVEVVILTGTDPAFCAGLDLKELADGSLLPALRSQTAEGTAAKTLRRGPLPSLRVPTIGAVNGPAVTGGLELALACDFLVASERAVFADTHARVGLQPSWGMTVLLPQAVGIRRAREMSATGVFLDAATALAWGLVNHVVPHTELMAAARELATEVASCDTASLRHLFATYDEGSMAPAGRAWEIEAEAALSWLNSGHGRASDVATRRASVIDRGSSKLPRKF